MTAALRANCIGLLAADALLRASSEIGGRVVNTFANSFCVRTVGEELVFVTNYSLRSPITINIDPANDLDHLVKPSDVLRTRDKQIRIGSDVTIDLADAASYRDQSIPTRRSDHDFSTLGEALRVVSFLLGIVDTRQSAVDPESLAHEGMARFIKDGALGLRTPNAERRFQEAALRIVGLGSGFTPSGDDTLGGFLATYNSLGYTIGRSPVLLESASIQERTSWVSAKLLDYMQRQILDEQVRYVTDSAAAGDALSIVLALETLFPRGHTSGIDICVGSVLALSIIRDVVTRKESAEEVLEPLGLLLEH